VNPTACNPSWVTLFSALATPTIAIILAYVAWRQWRTAQNRLKLDLFDRRLPIYQQTRDFLARRMALGQLETHEITDFTINTRVSKWLFNSSFANYLENEIAAKAQRLTDLNSELETPMDDTARKRNVVQQRELKEWLDTQLYEVIDEKFSEFLTLKHY
jgi:hypothetical protein